MLMTSQTVNTSPRMGSVKTALSKIGTSNDKSHCVSIVLSIYNKHNKERIYVKAILKVRWSSRLNNFLPFLLALTVHFPI